MKGSRTIPAIHAAVLMAGTTFAAAQAQDMRTAQINVPGISVVAPPPVGFDPLQASPAASTQYAIPPAPNPKIAPEAYEKWRSAVAAPQKKAAATPQNSVVPVLQPTDIFNGPNASVGLPVPLSNTIVSITSDNWSGTSVVGGMFSTREAIIGEFVVPTAHQAFGSCTGGWTYSSQWPGIDGNGSNDVLQAGTEVDAHCKDGTTSTFYSAWIEWYPYSETRVSAPVVHPGDLIFIEVWSTSLTTGYAYFYDYSTEQMAEYALTAPKGTTLKGDSVEWIVERPGLKNGLATLTNYIDSAWPYGVAWNYAASSPTYYVQGGNPAVGKLQLLTMLDDNRKGISAPMIKNSDFLWFQDFGSACGRAGAPPC